MDVPWPPRELCILMAGDLSVCGYEGEARGTGSRFLIVPHHEQVSADSSFRFCRIRK
jgi:hypothetical protein